jgi:hypothetical protein
MHRITLAEFEVECNRAKDLFISTREQLIESNPDSTLYEYAASCFAVYDELADIADLYNRVLENTPLGHA